MIYNVRPGELPLPDFLGFAVAAMIAASLAMTVIITWVFVEFHSIRKQIKGDLADLRERMKRLEKHTNAVIPLNVHGRAVGDIVPPLAPDTTSIAQATGHTPPTA